MKHIYKDPYELIKQRDVKGCVVTSGGFDPMHVGHLRCLQESAIIASAHSLPLVVIVNGDGFLTRKKGFAFMPHEERMEIIAGECKVVLDGTKDTLSIASGSHFDVAANSGFTITVAEGICEYVCSFLES